MIAALDGNSRANLCHHFLRVLDRVNDETELLVGVERALQVHRHPLQSKLKHFTFSPPKKFAKKMFHLGLAKRFLVRTVHVIAGQHGRLEFRFLKKQSSLKFKLQTTQFEYANYVGFGEDGRQVEVEVLDTALHDAGDGFPGKARELTVSRQVWRFFIRTLWT